MKQLQLATIAIITENKKYLLVKRAREPYNSRWAFISGIGAFDKTTNPQEAVKLEVQCDIRCDFQPEFFSYFHEEGGTPTIIFAFHGAIQGTPTLDKKYVSEYRWFTKEEIKK